MRIRSRVLAFLTLISLSLSSGLTGPLAAAKPNPEAATPVPTSLTFNLGGKSNPYKATCTATGRRVAGATGPTGQVTVTDVTAGLTLGTATLGNPIFAFATAPIRSSAGSQFTGMVTADFRGVGKQDIAVVDAENGVVQVLLGNGDGTFQSPVKYPVSLYSSRIVVADFNGDGKLDLAVSPVNQPEGPTQLFGVLLGNGDGSFQAAKKYSLGAPVSAFAAGDFNGDGIQDLLFMTYKEQPTPPSTGELIVFFGKGDGTFPSYTNSTTESIYSTFVVADFNGDGKEDVLAGGTLLVSNGDGTFQPENVVGSFAKPIIGDFNGDGKVDIATVFDGSLDVLLGNGDGSFHQDLNNFQVGNAEFLLAGDFNGDGKVDMLVGNGDVAGKLFLGDGTGAFGPPTNFTASFGTPYGVAAADFTGDGYSDILLIPGAGSVNAGSIEELQNGVSASTSLAFTVPAGTETTHALECSYNGDANFASTSTGGIKVSFQQASPPTFSLQAGEYPTAQKVSISDSSNADVIVIVYTTDGTTPTLNSTKYTAPITVAATETLKAAAFSTDFYALSAVSEASYTIGTPVAVPTLSPGSGTYTSPQTVTISDATTGAKIYYTTNGTTPTTASTLYSKSIPVTTSETIKAIAVSTGLTQSALASATYTIAIPTAPPSFSISAGTYGSEQSLILKDSTPGAVIYYTTDGTTPSTVSAKYSSPIPVSNSETINAIALAPGFTQSTVASAAYIVAGTPTVLIAAPTSIGTSGATLNALVGTGGVAATYSFQYGLTTSTTSMTPTLSLPATTTGKNVSAKLTGLKSGTTYFYRAVVSTVGGTSTSALLSFTTN
jgi:hypothetical protein